MTADEHAAREDFETAVARLLADALLREIGNAPKDQTERHLERERDAGAR